MVLLGDILEAKAKRAAAESIRALIHLKPQTAHLLVGTGEALVPAHTLVPKDRIAVRPTDRGGAGRVRGQTQ